MYFSGVGALGDLMDDFGVDVAPGLLDDWFRGRRELSEVLAEVSKSPVNAFFQGIGPQFKIPLELLSQKTFFPDWATPKTIYDRGEYFFKALTLGAEFNAVIGKPSRGYLDTMKDLFIYRIDPGQGAYRDIQDEKVRFLKKRGVVREGFFTSPRNQALYNFKLATRYKDKELQQKFIGEYFANFGTPEGMRTSFRNMDPLHGLDKLQRREFVSQLDVEGLKKLQKAARFYRTTLVGGR